MQGSAKATAGAPLGSLIDKKSAAAAVRLLVGPARVTELRALNATTTSDRWPHTISGYFDDPDKLAESLAGIKTASGIYIIPNPVEPALLARAANRLRKTPKGEATADTDIVRRDWLLIDTDAQRPSGISATDAEHEAALDRTRSIYLHLKDAGWPEPIVADSGNGNHLLYRIDLPTDDGGIVQRCLAALAERFDDDAVKVDTGVFNPARIWKLYGTLACKGDDTPDRPHRMACILRQPDDLIVVASDLLHALAGEPDNDTKAAYSKPNGGDRFDLESFITRNNLDVNAPEAWHGKQGPGMRWEFRTSPLCEHADGAAYLLQHASGAITAGCHHNSCGWTWADLRGRLEPAGNNSRAKNHDKKMMSETKKGNSTRPKMVNMATIETRPVRWLWKKRIPAGRITLAVGMPGVGKSFVTCDWASRVSTGTPWPDGSPCERGEVLFITAEDDPHDTLRPRLDAHHADVSRIHLLSGIERVEDGETTDLMFTLGSVEILEQAIKTVPNCKLVIIDPIGSFLGGQTDAHRDNEVRGVLAPVAQLAEKYGPAVLVVAHRRKATATVADDLAIGSRAFTGIARAVWHLSRDPENKDRRLFLPGKCNLAAQQNGLAFTIAGEPPAIHWERDLVEMSADDALAEANAAQQKKRGPDAAERDDAAAWLCVALADGPRPAKELIEEAREVAGLAKRTLDRARKEIGIEAYRPEILGPWWWRLSEDHIATPPKGEETWQCGNVGPNPGNNDHFQHQADHIARLPLLGNVVGANRDFDQAATDGVDEVIL